jgi:hypothetical protein
MKRLQVISNNLQVTSGQALITLLFYVIIILTITTAAVILIATNSLSATKLQEGELTYYIAEGGAENAILRVLRDPTYTGETNFAVGAGTADIVVTPGSTVTIVSTGKLGKFMRKVQVTFSRVSGTYNLTSWKEIQ